jgi:hypothetical protein
VPDHEQAPVVVEIFERYLAGWGYKEIASHLNRPGGPPPPGHVDARRNSARKWSKITIRDILRNAVYTGRLLWNRLDFRQAKHGDGPVARRPADEWIEAERRHQPLIPDEWFEHVQAEMRRRSRHEGSRRRSAQRRPYLLRGIVHCATGHNPVRMHGKERKGITYYACAYRNSYGDKAAEALDHGKWQYVREDRLLPVIDSFYATRIFGPERLTHFRAQHDTIARELQHGTNDESAWLERRLADLDRRLERQLAAIEAGIDPTLVGERIGTLKAERENAEAALADIEQAGPDQNIVPVDEACALLYSLPDLRADLASADPELRRRLYDAFRLAVEIDRNAGHIRLKALISSAFTEARDLEEGVSEDLCRHDRTGGSCPTRRRHRPGSM